jgi:FkbM family methyltransferase
MKFFHFIFRKAGSVFLRTGNLFVDLAYKIYSPPLSLSQKNKKEWYKIKGDETLRINYNLNESSIVFDIGGFKGDWCAEIYARYSPAIFVFEPVKEFYSAIQKRFSQNKKVKIFPFGLSGKTEEKEISVMSEASSTFLDKNNIHSFSSKEKIELKNIIEFISENNILKIDLMKINIEGGEYQLLDTLIDSGFIARVDNIQVQFHDFVENATINMKKIKEKLQLTHELTYEYIFVWENWKRK